ncbi:MucR family transcriptional regulator, partial [Azorhizobium oxalatiphilum]|uniref:MucR family transcriptional regulator n=1 Tax=Azorhizobium oxalatiphilum TaxID=980631 RepID=UPI001666A403
MNRADQSNGFVLALAAEIVASYVSNNSIAQDQLAGLISAVHASLNAANQPAPQIVAAELKPAVPIKKSVTP